MAERVLGGQTAQKRDAVPGLFLLRETTRSDFEATIYEPIVCLILQGSKETTVGPETVSLSQGQFVVVSHDLPVLARITEASPQTPYLAVVIRLELAVLRGLYDEVGEMGLQETGAKSLVVSGATPDIVDVLRRYMGLADNAVEADVLAPLIRKELHFRLLMSSSGAMLRSLIRRDSHASNISRAIATLRAEFRNPLEVAELARSVGMSTSSFHKHFKAITMTTPLRYQKELRLAEARRLLRTGTQPVSETALAVGYESPSQFSREYSRKFGKSPRQDTLKGSSRCRFRGRGASVGDG
ncbi:MAG: AraC family transcriptional regulator [Myxococcales bacterium]|nr:AraC family transcriptional regulator [Myxococcales bacterium]